ncbi:MAG: helix-turn-helix domain-containing protein [Candidatus Hodarchaeota archaeon]
MESISDQLKIMVDDEEIFKSSKLFKCILGLNEIETNVFSYLLKNDKVSTLELTNVLNKDRSLIQRALQALIDRNVILRESMSLKEFVELKGKEESHKRGYLFVYTSKDIAEIKIQFRELLEKWYHSMIKYIDNLDNIFDCFENSGELC